MIHPTAIVDPGAKIPASCRIGPFCTVGPDVQMGEECELISHVVLQGPTRLGSHNRIFPVRRGRHDAAGFKVSR